MSFREAVLASGSNPQQFGGIFGWGGKRGSAPSPFDAVDPARLAGPQGSHPLAALSLGGLVAPASDGLDGAIELRGEPVRVGEGIEGTIRLTARRDISARGAMLRLVGVRLTEQSRSREQRDSSGKVTSSEQWVEVDGKLFEQLPFSRPPLPASLSAGQPFEAEFTIPAPRLGPVSAHMGSALIGWAVEARWDIAMRGDERLATLVDVRQNIDYLRSGAVRLAQGAMFDAWQSGDATIAVEPLPPAVAGSELQVTVNWPSAGAGRGARLELQADVEAPNGLKGIVLWSAAVDPTAFRQGLTMSIPIPADAPATLEHQGLAVSYRIRALVDRAFRQDLAVERALAVI
ncbi:MAG TPA: hypothetical protein VMP67_08485 [Candidatus Limnocylindria bacterium]|nr:hypothetical protein [Candidatus Limnocylindria bacterium]